MRAIANLDGGELGTVCDEYGRRRIGIYGACAVLTRCRGAFNMSLHRRVSHISNEVY
jgi:hypothetical protein